MRRFIGMMVVMTISIGGVALPQAPDPGATTEAPDFETMTLEQALAYARVHSPKIERARQVEALARLDLRRTALWRRLLPSLTVHHGYNPLLGENRLGVGLTLSLDALFTGSDAATKAQLNWFDAQRYRRSVEAEVVLEVTERYTAWAAQKMEVEALSEALADAMKQFELQKIRFASGEVELSDVLADKRALSTLRIQWFRAQGQMQAAALRLKAAIGWEKP